MRNLAELNITDDRGEPVRRAPPSREVIAAFEREFDVSLPSEYLELLMYANGGGPEMNMIKPMGRTDIAERAINRFFYLNDDRNGTESLWITTKRWRPTLGAKQIPIAADGGGNPFVLDLRATPPRVVTYIVSEGYKLRKLASSFSEFIDRLELDPNMD